MTDPADPIRARASHVVAMLSPLARGAGSLDWCDTWLTVTLAIHELESTLSAIRKQMNPHKSGSNNNARPSQS